jgi:hypothetical protein
MGFGVKCPEPVISAIAVFWRGSKTGTQGHVGFVVGQDAKYLSTLGGNQSDAISVSRIDKARLLGCRWPKSAGAISVAAMGPATGDVTHDEAQLKVHLIARQRVLQRYQARLKLQHVPLRMKGGQTRVTEISD